MYVHAAVPLLLFSFALLWTKVQVQECHSFPTCNSPCFWNSCCEMKCTDSCNHTVPCQIHNETNTVGGNRWCTVEVKNPLTSSLIINITFGSSSPCTICNNETNMCCYSDDTAVLRINCSTVSTHSLILTPSSQSSDVTPPVSSNLLLATPSSSVPVTFTIISTVVPAVVGTALLCLMVAAVFGSIALVLCKTKRKQFPVTNNSDQMSQQRMDNTYSAIQITDLSSTDGVYVYSTLDKEETTTEIPHHLNTPALPTYSSLADAQPNTPNVEDLPMNYDVVRLENVSGNKTGVIDPYSSLADNVQKNTSNVKELPQNYDIVRLENMLDSSSKTGVIDQDSAEVIRVQPAAVYSTVVRQNGKKMTVKLDTTITLVDEKNAE